MNELFEANLYANIRGSVVAAPSPSGPNTNTGSHVSGSFHLSELFVQLSDGQKISLLEVFNSVVIHEDIHTSGVHGHVEIADHAGGLSRLYLIGGEKISMTVNYTQPMGGNLFSMNFIVYQVSKALSSDQNFLVYKLHFFTESYIKMMKKRLYKTFTKEKKMDELFRTIHDYLQLGSKYLHIEIPTIDTPPYTVPGYPYYDALDHLIKMATSYGHHFMFFERLIPYDNTGANHVFSTHATIKNFWKSRYYPNIYYNVVTSSVIQNDPKELFGVDYEIQENVNHMTNMSSGFYNGKIRTVDILGRNWKETPVTMTGQIGKLGGRNFNPNSSPFMNYQTSWPEVPGEKMMVTCRHEMYKDKENWVSNDLFWNRMNNTFRVNITIPGGNNPISVGNFVNLVIPSNFAKESTLNDPNTPKDTVYSGEYMVTAVRHVFNISQYEKKLELSRSWLGIDPNAANSTSDPPAELTPYGPAPIAPPASQPPAQSPTPTNPPPAPAAPVSSPAPMPTPAPPAPAVVSGGGSGGGAGGGARGGSSQVITISSIFDLDNINPTIGSEEFSHQVVQK